MRSELVARRQEIIEKLWKADDAVPPLEAAELAKAARTAVDDLEDIIKKIDKKPVPLECGRTYRYLGDAYFLLAQKKDTRLLVQGLSAYVEAERWIELSKDRLEIAKLNFNLANTLRAIGEAPDLPYLDEARARYHSALAIFQKEAPEFVLQVQAALQSLEIMRKGTEIYGKAKAQHKRVGDLIDQWKTAEREADGAAMKRIETELERGKVTGSGPREVLQEFRDLIVTAGPLIAGGRDAQALDEQLSSVASRIISTEASADDESLFAAVFEKIKEAELSGEVDSQRRETLESTFGEFLQVMRSPANTLDEMAARTKKMRDIIGRLKGVFLGAGSSTGR